MSEYVKQVILTGAMGAGKSTVLTALAQQGVACVPEPARRILSAQRAIGGRGVPETDPRLFCELMLAVAVEEFREMTRRVYEELGYDITEMPRKTVKDRTALVLSKTGEPNTP